ncbi:hypothetical protein [Ulvibacterium marinum]|uniref:Transposase InsH N-terminal domain-containing protein n=1 Tax=Ulvibacterium marinum TaxID=2419782 RepID=A0A3B0BUE4_9FLAO|nr:hypothetical protein [Ulvibacterium marinum]RKN77015.1 hypothetical protein D7Z94_24890 [Ulvibacterium marinum]
MQGRKNYTEKLFLSFRLSDRVPKDNLYRRLRETLDLRFLYRDTKELYGSTGNPSIDPVVFFKLLITGYLENLPKSRQAGASMESVVPKMPATPMDDHLKKVSEENGATEQRRAKTVSPAHITAPEHELKRVEKHHRNLREGPVQLVGASHKKARLPGNKTHYNPHDPDARISVKPGKAGKPDYRCSMVGGYRGRSHLPYPGGLCRR